MNNLQKILLTLIGGAMVYLVSIANYDIEDATQRWIPEGQSDVVFYLLKENDETVVVGFQSTNPEDENRNVQEFYEEMLLENRIENVGEEQALELVESPVCVIDC